MAKAKTKAPALAVPQTDEEADALLAEYGATERRLGEIALRMNDRLASLKAQYEADAKPLQTLLDSIFERLQAWGGAHRKRLTEGDKVKTVALPAGEVGWRSRPPSVTFQRGLKVEEIVERIRKAGMLRFLRRRIDVNKDAMIEDAESANLIDGVTVGSTGEDFFVAPFGANIAEPKP